MFCKNCGKEIDDNAAICIHCGCATDTKKDDQYNESKTGIGIAMGLFLGLIGLIIGIAIYPTKTLARNTFIKGWVVTFAISITICILIAVIMFSSILSLYGSTTYY